MTRGNEVLAVLCARVESERFPGKVLQDLGGRTVLGGIVERLRQSRSVGRIVVATTERPADDAIVREAAFCEVPVIRGSVDNVVERMQQAVYQHGGGMKYVLRALGDQPFLDWESVDEATRIIDANDWDFLLPLTFDADPVYGAGLSPWSVRVWSAIASRSTKPDELEHPGVWLRRSLEMFNYALIDLPHWAYRGYRLELDTLEDLNLFRLVHAAWEQPDPPPLRWVVSYLDKNRSLAGINAAIHERTGTFTTHTAAEVQHWWQDYANRTVVFSDLPSMLASTGAPASHGGTARCRACDGALIVQRVRPTGVLQLRCARCGKRTTYHADHPTGPNSS